MTTVEELVELDRANIWHPYSPTPNSYDQLPIASAEGVYLYPVEGEPLIDAMSSWWAELHGHRHPELIQAAHRQLDVMPHVMFGGLTHEPAVTLAQQLISLTGGALDKVFFSDSGSVSVEVAIKMALQYQRGIGHPERRRLLTWKNGYHGDTFGAMSVGDPENSMHSIWAGTLAEQSFAPAPPPRGSSRAVIEDYLFEFEKQIDPSIAAVIIEPIVQGAGGMRFHDVELVAGIRELCTRHEILLIADEIATAFGRTGRLFATLSEGITPDILCVGKALTGGVMTLAATLTTEKVADAIRTEEGGGALMHGPTFMGNPLACAVANASLKLIQSGYWEETVPRIEQELEEGLAPLRDYPNVVDVRVLGAIGVVEMKEPVNVPRAAAAAMREGIWIRPFGKLIYVMPPFICTSQEVATICAGVRAAVESES